MTPKGHMALKSSGEYIICHKLILFKNSAKYFTGHEQIDVVLYFQLYAQQTAVL